MVIFLAIYLVVDFLQKIDNFIEADVSRMVMASYFLYKIPYITVQLLPSATLISVIILFAVMRKNREIMALKACGLNLFGVFKDLVVVAVCLSVGLFLFSEVIARYASAKSNEIWVFDVEKRDPGKYYYGYDQIWYRGTDRIYWIWSFDKEKNIMDHPTFFFFDDEFRLKRRISGAKGSWFNDYWVIHDGYEQTLQENGDYRLSEFKELRLNLEETPKTFIRPVKQPEEMSFWELRDYAEKVRLDGYDNTRYLVDMHIKLAFPFVLVVMALIGISVPLIQRRTRTPLAVAIGMGICFLYMLLFGFSRSLGLSGVLPPLLAAWLSNLVFLLFGVYMMMRVER
jgi:lipopolysaccharide export system permease protein